MMLTYFFIHHCV